MRAGHGPASGFARRALFRRKAGRAPAIAWQPSPPWPGDAAAARRLARGILLFEGALMEAGGRSPWDVDPPSPAWAAALHGHGWLDHFGAAGERPVRDLLKGWVFDWIDRFGAGSGPGWAPELVARRVMRWIGHAPQLLAGSGAERSAAFFAALERQTRQLARAAPRTAPGVARIEALAGLVYAGLSLEGHEPLAERGIAACATEADRLVGPDGGIPSRNPEELAGVLELVLWTAATIGESGRRADPRLPAAAVRAAPVLRAMRHPDGSLARFHGARAVAPARLDAILEAAGAVAAAPGEGAMGYLHMAEGPVSLLLDAAPRPAAGHDSALAFEIALEGRPAVVNAGSGAGFGAEAAAWARTGAAHSGVDAGVTGDDAPVRGGLMRDGAGLWCLGERANLRAALGLTHERRLCLAPGGARLGGEETLLATAADDRARFEALHPAPATGCPVAVRFLLHPSVRVAPALAGKAAVLALQGGGRWMLRQFGGRMRMGENRYFDPAHLAPRRTREVAVEAQVRDHWCRVTWSLERLRGDAIPAPPSAALFSGAPGDAADRRSGGE